MVARTEPSFSLVPSPTRLLVGCCIFYYSLDKLCATQQKGSRSVGSCESEYIESESESESESSNRAAKALQTDEGDAGQPRTFGRTSKIEGDSANVFVHPSPISENRGTSYNLKKRLNLESQAPNPDKIGNKDIFPPAMGAVNRTSFGNLEESLIPTADEITLCQSNSLAGALLCNVTSKYPSSLIRNILNNRELSSQLFGNGSPTPEIETDTIGTKFPEDQGFKAFCATRVFLHYPRIGKTATNEWRYIIQSDDNSRRFVQGIRVEVCVKQNQKCDLTDYLPLGYELRCVQKYAYQRLLAISPDDKSALSNHFEFPSCCLCVYKLKTSLKPTGT